MPSKSTAQHNLMEMVAHDPEKAKRLGFHIPQKVAQDYVSADEQKKQQGRQAVAHAMSGGYGK